jgi:hypothetical protein
MSADRVGHGYVRPYADGWTQGCGGPACCLDCFVERYPERFVEEPPLIDQPALIEAVCAAVRSALPPPPPQPLDEPHPLDGTLEGIEDAALTRALAWAGGRFTVAAERLGISPRVMGYKVRLMRSRRDSSRAPQGTLP